MKQVKTDESTKRRVMTEEGWTKFRTELEKGKSVNSGKMVRTYKRYMRSGAKK